jgi:hypothetical protein
LDIVADGFADRRDHFGVEHDCRGFIGEFAEDFCNVLGGDGWKFVDLVRC